MTIFLDDNSNLYIKYLVVHIALGLIIYLYTPLSTIYFLGVLAYFIFSIFRSRNGQNQALIAAAYMMGSEVFFRMTGSAIPYEAGKYSVIGLMLLGLFFSGTTKKSAPYWLYLLLLIPGLIYSAQTLNYDTNVRKAIIFNLSGPFCLGISALYCFDRKITKRQFYYILWAILFPIVTMTTFLFVFTPDTRDVLTGTSSNFALSGGFGPNQVSTVLGIGIFVLIILLFSDSKNLVIFLVNLILLMCVSYRAILTFSRGGVYTAVVAAILFLVIYMQGVSRERSSNMKAYLIIIAGAIFITWSISSVRTMGLIDMRYANKDAAGRIKEDLSTGRKELISSELTFFINNPVFGIGVGKSKEYREAKYGIESASHNELSRLLSEHGIFGLAALMLLVSVPFAYRLQNRKNYVFYGFLSMWFLTINHSSMRIAAPAFIYALALLNFVNEKKPALHRQQAQPQLEHAH
ncbi:O-antigen ligase family protein [Leeuwenhoekiella sp. A2]|uniref:O-antigen ligase family protein n=1 Tax=Leeuwenhoekiella sp. A2 TaxID=3141460 RepID=UPI003A7FDF5A